MTKNILSKLKRENKLIKLSMVALVGAAIVCGSAALCSVNAMMHNNNQAVQGEVPQAERAAVGEAPRAGQEEDDLVRDLLLHARNAEPVQGEAPRAEVEGVGDFMSSLLEFALHADAARWPYQTAERQRQLRVQASEDKRRAVTEFAAEFGLGADYVSDTLNRFGED